MDSKAPKDFGEILTKASTRISSEHDGTKYAERTTQSESDRLKLVGRSEGLKRALDIIREEYEGKGK